MGVMQKVRETDIRILFRFALSSLGTIVVKITITWLFAHGINEYLSYFMTHCIILFWSYFSHLRFTFRAKHSSGRFWSYCKAVFLIKLLDFVLFGLFFKLSSEELSVSVLLASIVVSMVRFLSIRKAMMFNGPASFNNEEAPSSTSGND